MEDQLNNLHYLFREQDKVKSDLKQTELSLSKKIKESYNIMMSELKSHRDNVLKMVEETFLVIGDEVNANLDKTRNIIEDVTAEMQRQRKGLNTERLLKGVQARDYGSSSSDNEEVDISMDDPMKQMKRQRNMRRTTGDFKLKLKRKVSFADAQNIPYEGFQPKSRILVQREELIPRVVIPRPSSVKISIKLRGAYNIRSPQDSDVCDISSVCCLQDGNILLTDTSNRCLKLVDSDCNTFGISDEYNIVDTPFGVCHLYGD